MRIVPLGAIQTGSIAIFLEERGKNAIAFFNAKNESAKG